MNHLCTRSSKPTRDFDRIFIVNSHVRLSPLQKSHTQTILEIDCGNNQHYYRTERGSAGSTSSHDVTIELRPGATALGSVHSSLPQTTAHSSRSNFHHSPSA